MIEPQETIRLRSLVEEAKRTQEDLANQPKKKEVICEEQE